jgi:hypothetical protein
VSEVEIDYGKLLADRFKEAADATEFLVRVMGIELSEPLRIEGMALDLAAAVTAEMEMHWPEIDHDRLASVAANVVCRLRRDFTDG